MWLFGFLQNILGRIHHKHILYFSKRGFHVPQFSRTFCSDFQIRQKIHFNYKRGRLFPTEHTGIRRIRNWPLCHLIKKGIPSTEIFLAHLMEHQFHPRFLNVLCCILPPTFQDGFTSQSNRENLLKIVLSQREKEKLLLLY